MNVILRTSLSVLLMSIVSLSAFAGGGWVKNKGQGYYKLGQTWVSDMGYFAGEGIFSESLNTDLFTTSFYMEHGLDKGLSVELYLPFYTRHSVTGSYVENEISREFNESVGGLGDMNVGLRWKMMEKGLLNWSGTFTLGLPLGNPERGQRGNLFTGDGEFNQIIRTDMSAPFGGKTIGGYANVYGGFNNRSGLFMNEWLYGAELGLSAIDSRLWLIGRYNAIDVIGQQDASVSPNTFAASATFATYSASLSFLVTEKVGISFDYTGLASGEIQLVDAAYAGGVFINM